MTPRKYQIEIKFPPILHWKDVYKPIVSPYFDTNHVQFNVSKQGQVDEQIRMDFEYSTFRISLSWDRFVYIYEGKVGTIQKKNGPTKEFFNLVSEFVDQDLLNVKNFMLGIHCVDLMKDKDIDQLNLFNKKFFRPKVFNHIVSQYQEPASIVERKDEGFFRRIEIGPFSPSDVEKHGLSPLGSMYNEELRSSNGLMCKILMSKETDQYAFDTFEELLGEGKKTLKKIRESYE